MPLTTIQPPNDRRGADRPTNGDRRPCVSCESSMRFDERYVVARAGVSVSQPAWVCGHCGSEIFARGGFALNTRARPSATIPELRELRGVLAEIRQLAHAQRDAATLTPARMQSILEGIRRSPVISVLAVDHGGRHVAANVAACALTGYALEELLHMTVGDVCAMPRTRSDRSWRRFLDNGHFEGRCRLRRKTGEIITVECVASAHLVPGVHVGTAASRRLLQSIG